MSNQKIYIIIIVTKYCILLFDGRNKRKEVNKMKKYRKILQAVLLGIVLAIMLLPAIQGDINKQNEVNYNQPPTPPVADFHWTPTNPDVG